MPRLRPTRYRNSNTAEVRRERAIELIARRLAIYGFPNIDWKDLNNHQQKMYLDNAMHLIFTVERNMNSYQW